MLTGFVALRRGESSLFYFHRLIVNKRMLIRERYWQFVKVATLILFLILFIMNW